MDNAEGEGEIWFNTTSSDYKTIVKVAGSWASGDAVNTARNEMGGGSGTQTAALIYGGQPGAPVDQLTESYNGSTWTEVADLNTARQNLDSAATSQTDGIVFGGSAPYVGITEAWDGVAWTEVEMRQQ